MGSYRDKLLIPWDTDGDIGITVEGLIKLYNLTTTASRDRPLFPCSDCILFFRWNKEDRTLHRVRMDDDDVTNNSQ